jgi:hypothetical protein
MGFKVFGVDQRSQIGVKACRKVRMAEPGSQGRARFRVVWLSRLPQPSQPSNEPVHFRKKFSGFCFTVAQR